MNQDEFQTHVLQTLTNIETRLIHIKRKADALEEKIMTLGQANSRGYSMCKDVIQKLAQHQESINDDLTDAMGTVRELSWC
jgi:hypothetical protein